MKKTVIGLILVASFLVIGLLFSSYGGKQPYANVDGAEIWESDVKSRVAAEKCYGWTENFSEKEALRDLLEKESESYVLRTRFPERFPSEKTILEKSEWIARTNAAPELVDCIKKAYADAYLRLHVVPSIVNPILRSAYSIDPEIHKEERTRAANVRNAAAVARITLRAHSSYSVTKTSYGESPRLVENVLSKMREGELWPNAIEDDYSIVILELIRKDGESYEIGTVTIMKKPFEKWFASQLSND